jgi:hypothetical protein
MKYTSLKAEEVLDDLEIIKPKRKKVPAADKFAKKAEKMQEAALAIKELQDTYNAFGSTIKNCIKSLSKSGVTKAQLAGLKRFDKQYKKTKGILSDSIKKIR